MGFDDAIQGVTRRRFVAGATIAAGMSMTAGLSGSAFAREVSAESENEVKEDVVSPIVPIDAPASWDEEYDVVIVGSGGGIFGALRAVELGYSVIVVEKMGIVGGASRNASAWGPITNTECQIAAGYPDLTDTITQILTAGFGTSSNAQAFIPAYSQATVDVVDLITRNGCPFQPSTVLGPDGGTVAIAPKGSEEGGMTAYAISYAIDSSAAAVEKQGGTIALNTTATGLVEEDGAITGIEVSLEDGSTAYYKANKGVVIATGSFCANKDMLREYCPKPYKYARFSTAGPQDTGEGIRMLLGAGGLFTGYNCYCMFDGGINTAPDWDYYMYNAAIQLVRQPWLGINKFGDRYSYLQGGGEYGAQAETLISQPGGEGYVFFDANYEQYAKSWQSQTQMCRRLIESDMPDVQRAGSVLAAGWEVNAKKAIDDGLIAQADTISELADKLGLDSDVVQAAVDHWNEMCAAGVDADGIFPDNPEYLKPIDTPPFYGAANSAFLIATTAGVLVNEHAQVLSAGDAKPIPGLYAAGNCIGHGDIGTWSCFAAATAYLAVSSM